MRTLAISLTFVLVAVAGSAQSNGPHRARSAPVLVDASGQEIGVLVSLVERADSSVGIAPWAVIGMELDSREFGLELNSEGGFESSCDNWQLLCFEDSSCSGQPYLLAHPGCRTKILGLELAAVVGEQGWLPFDREGEGQWIEAYSALTTHGTCIVQPGVEILAVPAEAVVDLGTFTPPLRLTLEPSKKSPH